jgi:hypothetical protein
MADGTAQTNPVHPDVHNVTLTQSARLTLQGRAMPTQQVQYYVGDHGPFTDNYDLETFTPEEAQQGILARVHAIQQLSHSLPGPPVVIHEPPPGTTPIGPGEPQPPVIYHIKGQPPPHFPVPPHIVRGPFPAR